MAEVLDIAKIFMEKPIGGAFNVVRYAMGKKSLIKSLEKRKTTIQAWLVDASSSHLTSRAQSLAMEQLICALDELRDLLDRIATRELIISTNCGNNSIKKVLTWLFSPSLNPVVSSFRDVRRVKAFIEELDSIATPHSHLGSMLRLPSQTAVSPMRARCLETGPLSCAMVIGRDMDRDNVISLLFHFSWGLENISVVSIVGIGGVGKTTLAQYVFRDERVQNHFDVRLWVHVPQELVALDVVRKMVEMATNENIPETTQLNQLQYRLDRIISSKKYLLVIDNVWGHNLNLNWPSLMQQLGFGGRGSMVLTTTRSLRVAKTVGSVAPYMLGDLENDDSWSLFKIHAFRNAQDQELGLLEAIGKQIVRNCPKVPLVIRSVGCHLGGCNKTVSYWEKFRDKLDRLGYRDGFPDVLETLKLTYDDLDYWIKRCFACCSLFPKKHSFKENELIYLWIALELVEQPSNKSQSMVDVAKYYIHCLEEEGLFIQNVQYPCWKIHDVIHDLALSIGSCKFKMVDSISRKVDEMIQHISFTTNARLSGNFPFSSILKKKKQMQSLLVLQRSEKSLKLILKGLSGFKRLKVLGLRKAGLEEFPRTICELELLRYLDLSGNSVIMKLPSSITKLVNLVYLNLNGCEKLERLPVDLNKLQKLISLDLRNCQNLRKLPGGITKLGNLRELHLEGCSKLTHMPLGMRNMIDLQILDFFVCNEDPNVSNLDGYDEVGGFAELNCLNNLEGKLEIIVNGSSSFSGPEAREANLCGKKKLTELVIQFRGASNREHHEMMLEDFQPHTNLIRLQINGYGGERLPSWIDDCRNLEQIMISNWESGIGVGSFGRLPHLEALYIDWCGNIESSSTTGSNHGIIKNSHADNRALNDKYFSVGAAATGFPNLLVLQLTHVRLEVIPEDFRGVSSLSDLRIEGCEQLKELPEWIDTLTSLKDLLIWDCPELKSLPDQMAKLSNLELLQIENCPSIKGLPTGEDIPCFPKLKVLKLRGLGLEFIPDVFNGVYSLKTLTIQDCEQLKEFPRWIEALTSLNNLSIMSCSELTSLPNLEDLKGKPTDEDIPCFPKLERLCLRQLGLEFVPDVFKGASSLQLLRIGKCKHLKELPDWISTFTSLHELYIEDCPKLTSLPKQIANLFNLRTLHIHGNCSDELKERCEETTGQDWHLIQHVLWVDIY